MQLMCALWVLTKAMKSALDSWSARTVSAGWRREEGWTYGGEVGVRGHGTRLERDIFGGEPKQAGTTRDDIANGSTLWVVTKATNRALDS